MADLLKRSLAPLTDDAWREVDATAATILKAQLTARTLVDFSGPHGWQFAAVNLGRIDIPKGGADENVPWGVRTVLPLVEVRVPVVIPQLELDNASRGCTDIDLSSLEDAAKRVAHFEDAAVYSGFGPGGIQGIVQEAAHKPVKLPDNPELYPNAVAQGLKELRLAGVPGPYALVLSVDAHAGLVQAGKGGYPPARIIRDMLDGQVLSSQVLQGGLLLSTAGGDFELTVGQDLAIGYASHDRNNVELFLTESFTFRVLRPEAAIELSV